MSSFVPPVVIKIFLERYKIPVSIDEKLYALKDQTIIKESDIEVSKKEEAVVEEKSGENSVEVIDVKVKKVKKKKSEK